MTKDEVRQMAENDLLVFIRLLAPHLLLSKCHEELVDWWQSSTRSLNCLVLLPRGHLKSKLIAYKTVWELTRNPAETILYVSATSGLAEKQLAAMKKIMTSEKYRSYWPEMVNEEENKRELWTQKEISVDHPLREKEGIRDPSIKAAGLTTNITGFHATNVKLDDVVVPGNAYTEDGRNKVANLISQIASIKEPEAKTDCVGTRYHPKDLYNAFLEQTYQVYSEDGEELLEERPIWDVYTRVVETEGVFLWPRARREDGKFFGFNRTVLSRIKGEYEDASQFYSQYYNNPNDPSTQRIKREKFQYYDPKQLSFSGGRWYIHDQPLAIFAGMDFAFSLSKKADFTTLAVIGISPEHKYYVLDLYRFKTNKIKEYFDSILTSFTKWGYKKIRVEVTTAQQVIVKDLRDNYIVPNGLNLVVDEYRPTRNEGSKEERVQATLEPKYDNLQVFHYKGGIINELEDELVMAKPPHDDIKDALTAAFDIAVAPRASRGDSSMHRPKVIYNARFGGVA